jgi:two-component system response regulator (stage 0 sporulation protein A)
MKIKLFIIDDDIKIVNIVKRYFSLSENIEVVLEAYDGDTGYQKIKENQIDYDIILLDLILPKKDGIYILDKMKENNINKRVIIFTSFGKESIINKICEYDVDYFVLKPFDIKELENIVLKVYKNQKKFIAYNNKAEIIIIDILHNLGMPSHLKGYRYIKDAVLLIYKQDAINYSFMQKIYPKVAFNFETTVSCVERSIRHAIEISFVRGNIDFIEELFGYSISIEKTKPTNSEFITTVCDKIKSEILKPY